MKTIGDQAKEFRLSKGWNTTRMAKEVGTNRQSIENLEEKGDRKPRYIVGLAKAMGTTVDDLMNGTAIATLSAPLPTVTAIASASNHALAPVHQAQEATNNVVITEQARDFMAMMATLPDDPAVRYKVMHEIMQVIAQARDSPSHQGQPAYSHAATRAA